MKMITQKQLKCYFAAYPSTPPRTTALEQRIKIGTGFHDKWYQSQREHWLGWLVAKDCEARSKGIDPATLGAKTRWQRLLCSPAMFWVAECTGVEASLLDDAEIAASNAAKINDKDGQPHGKMMRKVLPWTAIETAILAGPIPMSAELAEIEARAAFDRLCQHRSEFRKLRAWLV